MSDQNTSIKFSIVIPNLNSPVIDKVIKAIQHQQRSLHDVEVIIIGQDKYGLIEPEMRVQFIQTGPTAPAKARNLAWKQAKGEIICFIDADCVVAPNWLTELEKSLTDSQKHIVCGTFTFPLDDYWTVADTLAHYSATLSDQPHRMIEAPSMNLALPRTALEEIGGFDERFPHPAGEDVVLTRRLGHLGYEICYTPRVTLFHEVRRGSLRGLWQHSFRFGRYAVWTLPEKIWVEARPRYLSHWSLALGSSVLAPWYVGLRVFWRNWKLLKFWYTIPAVLLAKFAWQLGVAQSLWSPTIHKDPLS